MYLSQLHGYTTHRKKPRLPAPTSVIPGSSTISIQKRGEELPVNLAERVRFELTSPVKALRFSSLMTRASALRTRTQSPSFPIVPALLKRCVLRQLSTKCNLSATCPLPYRPIALPRSLDWPGGLGRPVSKLLILTYVSHRIQYGY